MINYIKLPESEYENDRINIYVDGVGTFHPYITRVSAVPYSHIWSGSQRQDDQTEDAYFINLIADEDIIFNVEKKTPFTSAVIRPLSKNIKTEISDNAVKFILPSPGQYVLETDDFHNALHIFVNKPETPPENALVFKNGVHRIGVMQLESNTNVYIEDGAVIYGCLTAIGAENISICGNGIIDGSFESRRTDTRTNPNMHYPVKYRDMDVTEDMSFLKKVFRDEKMLNGCLRFYNCKNITVNGPILRDPCTYGVIAAACTNVTINNIKLIGFWKYNTDGIDIFNSRNVNISNCFVRSFDDSIVLKGIKGWDSRNMENVYISNCVVWCDWGRNLEFGAETNADLYRNIVFSNCDLVHSTHVMLDIQNTGRAHITDVIFQNIRCEYTMYQLKAVYQHDLNEKYPCHDQTNIWQPKLMFISNSYDGDRFGGDTKKGSVGSVLFKDIQVITDGEISMPASEFTGADNMHRLNDIVVDGLYFNGKKIEDVAGANITIGKYCHFKYV